MAEQGNLFEKLDEIKSGIEELKQPSVHDESKLKDFIARAERVFIYLSQKSEYGYDKKRYSVNLIIAVVLLLANIVVMAVPMLIREDNANLFCVPFVPVAVINILYIAFNIVKFVYIKSRGYEIAYDKIKVPWAFYMYDDNDIICGEKIKLPYKVLAVLVPFVNILAGVAAMILCSAEILVGGVVFGCVFILTLIIIFLSSKKMKGYVLYFRDGDMIIPYGQIADFMRNNNLK